MTAPSTLPAPLAALVAEHVAYIRAAPVKWCALETARRAIARAAGDKAAADAALEQLHRRIGIDRGREKL